VRESALFYLVARKRGFLISPRASAGFYLAESKMSQPNRDELVTRITQIAEGAGQAQGVEIVEVELLGGGGSRLLRIYIDKPEGVSHGDCEAISEQVGTALDAEDVIPGGGYTLEVSSPGIERKLKKPTDFQRFAGKKAKVVLNDAVEDRKQWEGTIRALEGNVVTLEPSEGKFVQIPLEKVRKANLKFEW
jgi:ribosome maturation factor RimP